MSQFTDKPRSDLTFIDFLPNVV